MGTVNEMPLKAVTNGIKSAMNVIKILLSIIFSSFYFNIATDIASNICAV